jgi:hypothetical protein
VIFYHAKKLEGFSILERINPINYNKDKPSMLTRSLHRILFSILITIGLVGCATSLDYSSPTTVDLTGTWVLDQKLSQVVIFPVAKSNDKRARPKGGGREGKQKRGRSKPGSETPNKGSDDRPKLNRDAALATEMKIEQSIDSMGVMYQNGNYREVNWGKTERRKLTITAGWKGEALAIKSKGGRITLSELYTLEKSLDVLTIKFEVDDNEYSRIYKRKNPENLETP